MTRSPSSGRSALEERLRRDLRGTAHFDDVTRGLYATDASVYQIMPHGVVFPASDEDVAATISVARAEGVSVTPRGAGTSQGGQAIGEGLVVDMSRRMNRILHVDRFSRTAVVEPGVVLDDLNRAVAEHGLFFPVDVATASRATLGGMAGNNSSGARSIRYGIMADHVRAVDAILADGTPIRVAARGGEPRPAAKADARARGRASGIAELVGGLATREKDELERRVPDVLRHVAGYNLQRVTGDGDGLAELLVGSEGTLAFFTRLELALSPLPTARSLAVCHFPSLHAALDAVQHVVTLDPSAVELTDGTLVALARRNPAFRGQVERFVRGEPAALLFVEFSDDSEEVVSGAVRDLEELMADRADAGVVVPVPEPEAQEDVWEVRRAGLNIVMSGRDARRPVSIIEDCAIPLERLAEWGDRLSAVFSEHGVAGTWYAHASVGCLHVRPSLDLKDAADVVRLREIAEQAHEIVRDLGGSHSGEHGDGLIRSEFIEPMLGPRLTRAFEEIKDAFDPDAVFNPGKIVRPGRMDDRTTFRYGPGYASLPIVPVLDWSAEGDLLTAVERCNNNGACRKRDPGVMCPSYRATSEEKDVTRGRANALRLALTGQLGPEALTSPELYDVMDLCVACKACRRECPMGVDMSRMKTEFLAHYRSRHGVPNRERIFAELPRLAPRLSRAGGILNLLSDRWLGAVREWTSGISRERRLPRWALRPFRDDELSRPSVGDRVVGLFADTFNRWFEPANLRAATRVLEHAGFDVVTPRWDGRPLCCGRTFLSAGLVEEARVEMTRTAQALLPMIDAGVPIVGLEPSCMLTLRDEASAILSDDLADTLASGTYLLDEFLVEERSAGRARLRLTAAGESPPRTQRVHVHGHCHQKAFATDGATLAMLSWIPGLEVKPIRSGCCGMAGSFGYEVEHQEVSRAMAELDLLPAVRGVEPNDLIVADGFSCRHQVSDLSDRTAQHAVRVLARSLSTTGEDDPPPGL